MGQECKINPRNCILTLIMLMRGKEIQTLTTKKGIIKSSYNSNYIRILPKNNISIIFNQLIKISIKIILLIKETPKI